MTTTMRLFIAVDPDAENATLLGQTVDHLRSIAPRAKWARAEKLHVTLVFLGPVEETMLSAVIDALRATAAMHDPFVIHFAGGGTFGEKERPRVLWTGIGGNVPALCALQRDLAKQLEAVGYTPEHRAYSPHLTLARTGDSQGDAKLALCSDELKGRSFGEAAIREVVLYRSDASEKGSKYTALLRVPLRR